MSSRFAARVVAVVLGSSAILAQGPVDPPVYRTPPPAIVDILDAEPLPGVSVSPTRDVLALLPRRSMPSIAELAQPMLRLAGVRVEPADQRAASRAAGYRHHACARWRRAPSGR